MYHKIHDYKEEDIGVSDYNRIQHIWKTFVYRIKGPVLAIHFSTNLFQCIFSMINVKQQKIQIMSHLGF